jgi:DNA modification methylase
VKRTYIREPAPYEAKTGLGAYRDFLAAKVLTHSGFGFPCDPCEVHPVLKPHQAAGVAWAVRGGRRAIFWAFGLGKSLAQLEILRLTLLKSGGSRGLIVCPLGVKQEFARDAALIGLSVKFVRTDADATGPGLYLTNYESVRDGKLDPTRFDAVSLDEAAILRGFGGTKTFRQFMTLFEGTQTFRFVATATPSPNNYEELLAYAAFLDVMDVGGAKTRFFARDSTNADKLTLHPHKAREFWLWVASWALFIQKPSDLGFSDDGYELPPLEVVWHEVPSEYSNIKDDRFGQGRLIPNAALGVQDACREKRTSLGIRIAKMLEIRESFAGEHCIYWHDREDERRAIERSIPGVVPVFGALRADLKEAAIIGFSEGRICELAGKPVMLGAGCNFQRHCSKAIYLGIGFKFADFIQSVHRLQRFLQEKPVTIHLIYTEAETEIKAALERKWEQHKALVAKMAAIIREFGLTDGALSTELGRSMGCERQEVSGKGWRLVNNDCVEETMLMESDSVGLILTSIPFSTQYEYSPSYNDFGHSDNDDHFFKQMDFLSPELLRILKPGRDMVIHVKDRIVPGGLTGLGGQTVSPLHAFAIEHYRRHGFSYLGMHTVVTDVVRENKQTNRLGWTEQCKDGSRMGCGMPEYLLLFRKPPTDRSNGYADEMVVKSKDDYTRARWQFDAHGFWRSSGNRLLIAEDFGPVGSPLHKHVFRRFRKHSKERIYDHETDVAIADRVSARGMLPPSFQLLQPQSLHPDVWTDITRMLTLNMLQEREGREQHICPMQFDIADRVIRQRSQPGDVVFDPFAGLGTVPQRAVLMGRIGWGCELSSEYFHDSAIYLRDAEIRANTPTLFDVLEIDDDDFILEQIA